MSLTYSEAVDDIKSIVHTAWETTGNPPIHWESVKTDRSDSELAWMTFVTRHSTGSQTSLGGIGNRIFERSGLAIASIFSPIGKDLSESYLLAKVVADAYEGQTSENGVWFRNVRIQEIGRDGQFYHLNVLVDFEYTETK